MSITKKDVEYVSKLARIKMNEQEIEDFTSQLDHILDYMKKLNELNNDKIVPTSHILDIKNVNREDIHTNESLTNEDALKMAPSKENPFYKVPKVIE